jgi:hypothetical protein
MEVGRQKILAFVVVIVLGAVLFCYYVYSFGASSQGPIPDYYASMPPANVSSVKSVTGTSVDSASDIFFTKTCVITGIGGFALRVVSDSTGVPVAGEGINAVGHLGCGSIPQIVYLNNFTVEQGGWLTPVFPKQATPGGELSFTVSFQGRTYDFSAGVAPVGSACVTLHVPSGKVSYVSAMNGQGFYCWQ